MATKQPTVNKARTERAVSKVRTERKTRTERAVDTEACTERTVYTERAVNKARTEHAVDTEVHRSKVPRVLDPAKGTFDNIVRSPSVYSTERSGCSPSAQWSKVPGVLDHEDTERAVHNERSPGAHCSKGAGVLEQEVAGQPVGCRCPAGIYTEGTGPSVPADALPGMEAKPW